LEHVNFK